MASAASASSSDAASTPLCIPLDLHVSLHSCVLFCASHIRDDARLEMFERMLQSVCRQKPLHPGSPKLIFWLSISFASEELRAKAANLLKRLKANQPWRIFARKRSYSQFEHYAFLVRKFATDPAVSDRASCTWVAFVDDDDEIGSERIQKFYSMVTDKVRRVEAPFTPPFVGICSNRVIPLTESQRAFATRSGYTKAVMMGEYTSYCVYLPAILYFVEHATPQLLANRFCDLALTKFLARHDCALESNPASWVEMICHANEGSEYVYWTRPGSDQARDSDGTPEYHLTRYLMYDRVYANFDEDDYQRYMAHVYALSRDAPDEAPQRVLEYVAEARRLLVTSVPNVYTALLTCPTYFDWYGDKATGTPGPLIEQLRIVRQYRARQHSLLKDKFDQIMPAAQQPQL